MEPVPLLEIARFTSNVAAAVRFYSRLLGQEPDSATEEAAVFSTTQFTLLIHGIPPENPDFPPSEDHLAFPSCNLEEQFQELSALYDVVSAPKDYPWGRSAYLRDPDGRLIELSQAD